MGSWWRSQEMTYVSMIISEEAAPACVRELGVLGCIQFADLNPELTPFQRPYVSFIKRCDEMERKIRYLHGEIKKMNIPLQSCGSVGQFVHHAGGSEMNSGSYILEGIEAKLEANEKQLLELNRFGLRLREEYEAKLEMHHVLCKARQLFTAEMESIAATELSAAASHPDRSSEQGIALNTISASIESEELVTHGSPRNELAFTNIAGVMRNSDRVRFERLLFRSTRGNCWVRFVDIEEYESPHTAMDQEMLSVPLGEADKCVFIIFFKSAAIQSKIRKICEAFQAKVYDIQSLDRPEDLESQQNANDLEMVEARTVLQKNLDSRAKVCQRIALSLEEWFWITRREKGMYHTLNMMSDDVAGNLLRGRGWIITSELERARAALNRLHTQLSLPPNALLDKVPGKWPTPPTHFQTNKYTDAFQEFVNTYGVPRYREANPALFTAATFPFLFGVMYGDIGHGSCLLFFACVLILTESYSEQRGLGELMRGLYSARYMLFGMGLCAVYAGSIYNDYFSLPLATWSSDYLFEDQHTVGADATQIGPYGDPANVYPFGIDPAWRISDNQLLFFNSLKMKMSVVLGVTQMTWGIILKGVNTVYFGQWLDFYCEFIPMMIFNLSFFGYMIILIFVKWGINWEYRMGLGTCGYNADGVLGACQLGVNETLSCYTVNGAICDAATPLSSMCPLGYGGTSNGCQPPNLITTMMNMALAPGSVDEPLYQGQAGLQTALLLLAFLSVPWLLCVKPYLLKHQHESDTPGRERMSSGESDQGLMVANTRDRNSEGSSGSGSGGNPHAVFGSDVAGTDGHEEFNFGEIMIHQAIETIEFVLGMVSNTASYLRLWALSLAHSQLAEVFWDKALLGMIKSGNPAGIYVGYAVFAAVTFGVLLCMDVLECFLHSLRLHWVEFQNKFYKADGHKFQPFDYRQIIQRAVLE